MMNLLTEEQVYRTPHVSDSKTYTGANVKINNKKYDLRVKGALK
jgi:hypothetical protein